MAKNGYLKLFRSIQDNELWLVNKPFDVRSAWIDLMLLANHEDRDIAFNGGTRTIKRGQFHTSMVKLAKRWHWDRKTVSTYLSALTSAGMVTTERTSCGTTVTIVNYGKFQDVRSADSTTDSTATRTAERTTERTATSPQTRSKEGRSKKKNNKAAPSSFYSDRPRWHIEGEYEFWLDDDGCWHRALIGQKEEE